MKKLSISLIFLCVVAVFSFWAGGRYGQERPAGMSHQGEVTPAESIDEGKDSQSPLPGEVKIDPSRQQLIGVKVSAVQRKPMIHTLRLYGRVVLDETKVYRLNASTDSWVRELSSATTGSLVRKDEILAEMLAPAFFNAQNNYVIQLGQMDRVREQLGGELRPQQTEIANNQILMALQGLQTLGITDAQIAELAKTRKARPYLEVRAPARGVVLSRKITLNQWFKAGEEFYTIADIGKVWVYADIYEGEAIHIRPGMTVKVRHVQMGKSFSAKVGAVLPLFDSSARTLKVRVDVDNPRYDLRPDMFVDVEIPITLPASINIPAEAVLDTGTRKIVYVEKGNGVFEPRRVETGWRYGGQVEITDGLLPGDKVAVSGNFLIDSESRMEITASGADTRTSEEPARTKVVEKQNMADRAKDVPAAPAKARATAKAKTEKAIPAQPRAAAGHEGCDSEEDNEGPWPFPGAQYLGTVPRDPAPVEGEPPKDRLPPRQFEIPTAPPSGTRLK